MEERKNTHIATTCKLEKIKTPSEEELLICIPIEVAEGTLGSERKFIDTDGIEHLPAYDAFLKGEKIGYILDVSFDEMLKRGRKILEETMGYSYAEDESKDTDLVIHNYKDEYVSQLEEFTWFFDLKEVVSSVLSCDENEEFYEMYGVSIDRKSGSITTKAPKKMLTGKAYADFREEIKTEESKVEEPKVVEEKPKLKITRIGLIEHTKKYVIAQDEAVELIASAIYNPICLNAPKLIQNVLLYGPTGVGKTLILETIAQRLDLPYFYTSIADFSSTGYVGKSVDDIYEGLYKAADKDIKKLEKGAIVFIDEVDKLLLNEHGGPDIKTQVYNELLPLYQHGGTVTFKLDGSGGFSSKSIKYNKDRLIVVTGGSFARLEREQNVRKAGFGGMATINAPKIKYYSKKDFEKFGVPIEWLGRQDLCIPLAALDENDLYRILTEALGSPYIATTEALKLNGINLNVPETVLRQMAHKAYVLQTGARSLRGIFEFAIQNEMNRIVDSIDAGSLSDATFDISEEAVVKKLEKYHG